MSQAVQRQQNDFCVFMVTTWKIQNLMISRFSFPVTLFLYECMPSKVSVKISQFRKMNGNANAFVKWWLWYYMHNRNIALNIYSCLKNRAEWRLHGGNDGRWELKSFCFLSSHNRKTYLPNFLKKIIPQSQNYWSKIQMCDFAALNIKKK